MQMYGRARFAMHEQMISAGTGEVVEVTLGLDDHQMHIHRFGLALRTASTTTGPIVMFGTKRPSITSTWIQSPPAASTACTSSASRPKSADKIDGATMIDRVISAGPRLGDRPPLPAAAPQQVVRSFRTRTSRRIHFERDSL